MTYLRMRGGPSFSSISVRTPWCLSKRTPYMCDILSVYQTANWNTSLRVVGQSDLTGAVSDFIA
jgi:hypothetical protein